jgi:hypothetical protein
MASIWGSFTEYITNWDRRRGFFNRPNDTDNRTIEEGKTTATMSVQVGHTQAEMETQTQREVQNDRDIGYVEELRTEREIANEDDPEGIVIIDPAVEDVAYASHGTNTLPSPVVQNGQMEEICRKMLQTMLSSTGGIPGDMSAIGSDSEMELTRGIVVHPPKPKYTITRRESLNMLDQDRDNIPSHILDQEKENIAPPLPDIRRQDNVPKYGTYTPYEPRHFKANQQTSENSEMVKERETKFVLETQRRKAVEKTVGTLEFEMARREEFYEQQLHCLQHKNNLLQSKLMTPGVGSTETVRPTWPDTSCPKELERPIVPERSSPREKVRSIEPVIRYSREPVDCGT